MHRYIVLPPHLPSVFVQPTLTLPNLVMSSAKPTKNYTRPITTQIVPMIAAKIYGVDRLESSNNAEECWTGEESMGPIRKLCGDARTQCSSTTSASASASVNQQLADTAVSATSESPEVPKAQEQLITSYLLLICGPIGSGKSYMARNICDHLNDSVKNLCYVTSFAEDLKREYAKITCGESSTIEEQVDFYDRLCDDRQLKHQHRNGLIDLAATRRAEDPDYYVKRAYERIRLMLLDLESSIRAHHHDDTSTTAARVLFVIDDWRYPNELEYLATGTDLFEPSRIWHTRLHLPCRPNQELDRRPSERALEFYFGRDLHMTYSRLQWSALCILVTPSTNFEDAYDKHSCVVRYVVNKFKDDDDTPALVGTSD